MKKIIISILITASSAIFAQQDAMYTQYMFNMLAVNPAYAGSRDVLSLTALYRNQWVGLPGAPKTLTFSADMPLANEKLGLGLQVSNDAIGVFNVFGANASLAYRIRFEKSTLAFGMNAGVTQFQANLQDVGISDDPAFGNNINKTLPNIGAGVFWSNDRFYVGLSLPKLLNSPLSGSYVPRLVGGINSDAKFRAQQFRHAFLMAGYVINISDLVKFKPSILVKMVTGAPIQMDLNANVYFYDKIGIGLSYRSLDAPSILLEWQATEQFRIGYAFDWTTKVNNFGFAKAMSHEIMLRYEMGFNKAKVLTPRYF